MTSKKITIGWKAIELITYAVLGIMGWALSFLLVMLGFAVTTYFGYDAPPWSAVLCFVVGLPFGALIEKRVLNKNWFR